MQKFLVISYDDDQQQCFFDWVLAPDEDDAIRQVEQCRDYAVVVEVLDAAQVGQVAGAFTAAPDEAVAASWRELLIDHHPLPALRRGRGRLHLHDVGGHRRGRSHDSGGFMTRYGLTLLTLWSLATAGCFLNPLVPDPVPDNGGCHAATIPCPVPAPAAH